MRLAKRRTHASVTDVACTCDYLQHAADDPRNPIVFDALTNEYHYTYQEPDAAGPSTLNIYHCPFCGGAAPESKRRLLFSVIPSEEEQRLARLLAPVRTARGALKRLGKPQRDDPAGIRMHTPEADGRPPGVRHHRVLVYEKLSDVADVWFTEGPDGRVSWQLMGKQIARRSKSRKNGPRARGR